MTLDGGWALIISGVLVLFLTGVAILVWRHVDNAQADAKEAIAELHRVKEAGMRFETHVAENYARLTGVERMETNLNAGMQRVEGKLDSLITSLIETMRSSHG